MLVHDKARAFAITAHGDQMYGNRSYDCHLAAVVRVLEDCGCSEEYRIAGWLHDVVEDTEITIQRVSEAFGERVASLVWAVTGEGRGDRHAHSQSIYAKIDAFSDAASVKLADRIANLEACEVGDKHSIRYGREHEKFSEAIKPHVSEGMWKRYLRSLEASQAATS